MSARLGAAIVGAGPAGLSAAIEIARNGGRVAVYDENSKPGGQLFKQTHKFFGSQNHGAGIRGFRLGESMLAQCEMNGVDIRLSTTVFGLFPGGGLGLYAEGKGRNQYADCILIATGATERPLAFPGWDLPGVMGAGAAQAMANLHRVRPGSRVLMVGSGNVGLVVAWQLMQAGCEIVGVVDIQPDVSGYQVHANKLWRAGVPFYSSHVVSRALGRDRVTGAVLARTPGNILQVGGDETTLEVDTICVAVGLMPSVELAQMAGCQLGHYSALGGFIPYHDEEMQTTQPGVWVAGDTAGVEEASTAMEEGRLAGLAISHHLGLLSTVSYQEQRAAVQSRLAQLRLGTHGDARQGAKAHLMEAMCS